MTRQPSREEQSQILDDVHYHAVNINTREIYIHSHHRCEDGSEETGVDFRQAITFVKNLHLLDHANNNPILMHLQSIGGSWSYGMSMFNAIQFSKSPITMLAYAQASSMSGIILQAAPVRVLMPDCYFLMHHGSSGGAIDHPFAIKTAADYEMKMCERMLQIFAQRAYKGQFFKEKRYNSAKIAFNFFDKKIKENVDWYLSAEEAVYYGLADGIMGDRRFKTMDSLRSKAD